MQYDHMPDPSDSAAYRSLPAQIIEIDGGVIVVRGCTEIKVMGDGAIDAVRHVWSHAAEVPASIAEIAAAAAEPDREGITQLARKLIERRILVSADDAGAADAPQRETSMDIFLWHFGLTEAEAASRIDEKQIAVIGVNAISRRLCESLQAAGIANLTVVDFALLRNQRLFGSSDAPDLTAWPDTGPGPIAYREWLDDNDPKGLDCLIVTSDFGAASVLRDWNAFCVENRIGMLPVMLRKLMGYIGPMVIPGETACYHCLQSRENSHIDDFDMVRKSETHAPQLQGLSGFFPSMGSILGDLAAMELFKFYTGAIPSRAAGSLVEVNLLGPSLASRRVLRVPRCPTCAAAVLRPSASLERADFIPGPQFYEGADAPDSGLLTPEEKFGGKTVEKEAL
ncbi:TOMM precursor leader peptide-binding protein [uncultured Tateyamaria sp.]|uniref:TOMM precursor leader peptide-binding protein n=1 Tax=uncultured Tateyamaria sp. TaxID=455651 RepID=UPI00262A7C6C|nr:TOMM precursor leader peptide-binding protein [uncultured Tateyamaria sp.]